jgi:[ribosomal protein S5]-alanine N-acetyltransferase
MSSGPFASLLAGELVLTTRRFALTPLASADAADFLAHLSDPAVVEYMDIDPHTEAAETLDVIAWAQGLRAAGNGVRWVIRDHGGGVFIGTAGFNTLVWERGCRGEVAYDISKRFWGRRVMDEVLPTVMAFGFDTLGLRRIEAMVTLGNEPSCRLLERHGFEREGVLREHAFWKDRFWDQVIYGRLG